MTKSETDIHWDDCEGCGSALMAPENVYDGHSLICEECSMIHWISCDDGEAFVNSENKFYYPSALEIIETLKSKLKSALARERELQRDSCEREAAELRYSMAHGGPIWRAVDVAKKRGWHCYDEKSETEN